MSGVLMTLLGKPHNKQVEIIFADLEKSTGARAIDTKLIGDILHKAHRMIRDMGLDQDITAQELYYALRMHRDMLDNTTAYVGIILDGGVISFNAKDVMSDQKQSRHFADRTSTQLQINLAHEIEQRYKSISIRPGLLQQFKLHTRLQRKEYV